MKAISPYSGVPPARHVDLPYWDLLLTPTQALTTPDPLWRIRETGTMRVVVLAVIGGALAGCATSPQDAAYQAYRRDSRAALREVVRCESNYAAIGETPQCRAALRINSELFPIQ